MAERSNIQVYGNNRAMSYWSPEVRAAMLHSKSVEVEAFARDRQLDPGILMGIAEATMRLGRIPEMAMYGLAEDDARAFTDFLADVFLNTEDHDETDADLSDLTEDTDDEPLSEATVSSGLGAFINHFQGTVKRAEAQSKMPGLEIGNDDTRVRVRIGESLAKDAITKLSEIGVDAHLESADTISFDLQGMDLRESHDQVCETLDRLFSSIYQRWPGFRQQDVSLVTDDPTPTARYEGTYRASMLNAKGVKTLEDMDLDHDARVSIGAAYGPPGVVLFERMLEEAKKTPIKRFSFGVYLDNPKLEIEMDWYDVLVSRFGPGEEGVLEFEKAMVHLEVPGRMGRDFKKHYERNTRGPKIKKISGQESLGDYYFEGIIEGPDGAWADPSLLRSDLADAAIAAFFKGNKKAVREFKKSRVRYDPEESLRKATRVSFKERPPV